MAEEKQAPVEQAREPVATEKKTDTVAYETHKKLLGEKKSLQERLLEAESKLNEFQSSVEQRERQELETQNRFKELYEGLKGENENLKNEITQRDIRMQDALKVDAFEKSLGDRVIDRKYSGFINTKNIMIDPSSGVVDELSAQKEVERVLAEDPEIVRSKAPAKALPTSAPSGASSVGKVTMQDRFELLAKHLETRRR